MKLFCSQTFWGSENSCGPALGSLRIKTDLKWFLGSSFRLEIDKLLIKIEWTLRCCDNTWEQEFFSTGIIKKTKPQTKDKTPSRWGFENYLKGTWNATLKIALGKPQEEQAESLKNPLSPVSGDGQESLESRETESLHIEKLRSWHPVLSLHGK